MTPTRAALSSAPAGDRLARGAERALRLAGDARVGLLLLLLTGLANLVAALVPGGAQLLEGWPYAILLGALALSGVATVAVRAPAAWREWRHPGQVAAPGALQATLALRPPSEIADALRRAGYRARVDESRGRWAVHGVRRGWSRFAGVLSHAALVIIVFGAATGAAFGSETTFSLLPGEQALLDAPREGFSAAVRLEALDAEFGPGGRPTRLDTTVTFLRDGEPVSREVLRVNEPGTFDGHLVHPWTYGPAVRLRVTTLGGAALLDDAIPLDEERGGVPVGSTRLPTADLTLGLALVNAESNLLGVSAVAESGLVDTVRLLPGESARVGDLLVELRGYEAWVTFLSRRDPGLAVLFAGAALLCGALAVAFWLPCRRVTVRPAGSGLRLFLRGERFDRPADELGRLERELSR
jgi:ResB-like family